MHIPVAYTTKLNLITKVGLNVALQSLFFSFVECPPAPDGMERFACPTPDRQGRYHCIDDHVLCDGFIDCPSGEDEDRQDCMFYKTVSCFQSNLGNASI